MQNLEDGEKTPIKWMHMQMYMREVAFLMQRGFLQHMLIYNSVVLTISTVVVMVQRASWHGKAICTSL